jgi:uncharacterized protein (DUF302 family)
MKKIAAFLAVGVLLLSSSALRADQTINASRGGLVVIDSANTMADTEGQLVAALDAAGLKVAARIDHAANAKSVGLDLAPTVLFIFGNPKAGTALIQADRTVGIDLPLKVLIWDDGGKVKIGYSDPNDIARRHGMDANLPVLAQMTTALQRITNSAASKK